MGPNLIFTFTRFAFRCQQRFVSSYNNSFRFNSFKSSNNNNDLSLNYLIDKLSKFNKPNLYDEIIAKNKYISTLKRASVLVPISIKEEQLENGLIKKRTYFTLSKRTERLSSFSGQVCFMGGKKDDDDKNDIDTAYREAYEEAGINANDLVFLAQVCPIITFNSILVTPVLAYFDIKKYVPKLNKDEVEMVFDLPTERFLSNLNHKTNLYSNKKGKYLIHYFDDQVDGKNVCTWGFTAFMSIVISTMINSRKPEFEIVPKLNLDENNLNEFLERFLVNKLKVVNDNC